MNYLIYIEHAAENLQFFLWYRDYEKRFTEATTPDIALAPEWTRAMEEEAIARIRKEHVEKRNVVSQAGNIFKGTDFEKVSEVAIDNRDPFSTPPHTAGGDEAPPVLSGIQGSSIRAQAYDAFEAAGVRPPCKSSPAPGHVPFLHYPLTFSQLRFSPSEPR
jgi:hypothetical protein